MVRSGQIKVNRAKRSEASLIDRGEGEAERRGGDNGTSGDIINFRNQPIENSGKGELKRFGVDSQRV